jgi:hypothetical protein
MAGGKAVTGSDPMKYGDVVKITLTKSQFEGRIGHITAMTADKRRCRVEFYKSSSRPWISVHHLEQVPDLVALSYLYSP